MNYPRSYNRVLINFGSNWHSEKGNQNKFKKNIEEAWI